MTVSVTRSDHSEVDAWHSSPGSCGQHLFPVASSSLSRLKVWHHLQIHQHTICDEDQSSENDVHLGEEAHGYFKRWWINLFKFLRIITTKGYTSPITRANDQHDPEPSPGLPLLSICSMLEGPRGEINVYWGHSNPWCYQRFTLDGAYDQVNA